MHSPWRFGYGPWSPITAEDGQQLAPPPALSLLLLLLLPCCRFCSLNGKVGSRE